MSECKNKDKGGNCKDGISDPSWCRKCNPPPPKAKPMVKAVNGVTLSPKVKTTKLDVSAIGQTTGNILMMKFTLARFDSKKTGVCSLSGEPTNIGDPMVGFPKYVGVENDTTASTGAIRPLIASNRQVHWCKQHVGDSLERFLNAMNGIGNPVTRQLHKDSVFSESLADAIRTNNPIARRMADDIPSIDNFISVTTGGPMSRHTYIVLINKGHFVVINPYKNADNMIVIQHERDGVVSNDTATFRDGVDGVLYRIVATGNESGGMLRKLLASADLQNQG